MRTDPPDPGPGTSQPAASLDLRRGTALLECEELTGEQLGRASPATSDPTLGGLLDHLAPVEDSWFRVEFLGEDPLPPWAGVDREADPDREFRTAAATGAADLRERYRSACERSRAAVRSTGDLDRRSVAVSGRTGEPLDLRWTLLHVIEETARHAGHADLPREAVDGEVGE